MDMIHNPLRKHRPRIALMLVVLVVPFQASSFSKQEPENKDLPHPSGIQLSDGSYVYFKKEPYVNSRIIEAMNGWESDPTHLVRSINLDSAQDSNEFFIAEVPSDGSRYPNNVQSVFENEYWSSVTHHNKGKTFSYRWVGKTLTGAHVLKTQRHYGTGSFFTALLFLTTEGRSGGLVGHYDDSPLRVSERESVHLVSLGGLYLANNYLGNIYINGNTLTIGPDQGRLAAQGRGMNEEDIVVELGF